MRIGVPKEIKPHEYRVGLTPGSVREYVAAGHRVIVEAGAGAGIGADDEAYRKAGAVIADTAEEIFASAGMIVKVKEPQPSEWSELREGQILFTYLHLAPDPEQTRGLLASRCTAIAYETVTHVRGGLPLLAPMLFINLVIVSIETFNTFDMVLALTGGGPGRSTEIAALSVYNQIFEQFNLGQGAATAVLLVAVNLIMTFVYVRFLERDEGVA